MNRPRGQAPMCGQWTEAQGLARAQLEPLEPRQMLDGSFWDFWGDSDEYSDGGYWDVGGSDGYVVETYDSGAGYYGYEWWGQADLTGHFDLIPGSLEPGDSGAVGLTVTNVGDDWASGPLTIDLYLSSNLSLGGGDVWIGSIVDGYLDLAGGYSEYFTGWVDVPAWVVPGSYHILADIDADDRIAESDEWNNLIGSDLSVYMPVYGDPDLEARISGSSFGNIMLPGETGYVNVVIDNNGTGWADDTLEVDFYLSTDTTLDADDAKIGSMVDRYFVLGPDGAMVYSPRVTIPTTLEPGDYYILADLDPEDEIDESDEANNLGHSTQAIESAWVFGAYGGYKNLVLGLTDAAGVNVVFSLTGGGYGRVTANEAEGFEISFTDTSTRSDAKITTAKGKESTLHEVVVEGSLRSLYAPAMDLAGSITVAGAMGRLTLDDVAASEITIGPAYSSLKSTAMTLGDVADLTIDSQMALGAVSAVEWRDTDALADTIDAPSISSVTTRGDGRRGLAGDFEADITAEYVSQVSIKGSLIGSEITLTRGVQKAAALGRLSVTRWVEDSFIRSAGNITSVAVGGMKNSAIFAGVTTWDDADGDGVADLPADVLDLASPLATIASLTVRGLKSGSAYEDSFINSNIAAGKITTASLAYAQLDNGGTPFGLAATSFKKVSYRDAALKFTWTPAKPVPTYDDFEIRLV